MQSDNISNIKIELIIPNSNQPRKLFNETSLNELASSIKSYGILNPILVRKKDNLYEIIAGERRYRAAKIAGLTEIPAIIKNVNETKMSEIAMVENIQRENINPIEEAKSYQEILNNNNITEKELSDLIGKSQPFISNKIRLLSLHSNIQEALINKKISEKHARSLLKLKDQSKQILLLNKIIEEKLSVRDLDRLIDKEEEKESDNMNNGNFFPNYNNQQNENNMTLNSMNMQSINNNQINPIQQPNTIPTTGQIIPESPTISNFNESTISNEEHINTNGSMNQLQQTTNNIFDQTMPNLNEDITSSVNINETQNLNSIPTENNDLNMMPNNSQPNNPSIDIPLFSEPNFNQVNNAALEQNKIEQYPNNMGETSQLNNDIPEQPTVLETPLFNQELNNIPVPNQGGENANLNESFYEVPVNISPVIEEAEENKVNKVQQLLSSNGIEYKTYSNESGHCIIIEL